MAQITIDDRTCPFDGRKTILQVALEHRVRIPHYCYHPGLSVVASCRICLAEVASPDPRQDGKLQLVPKLVPTCQHAASDGMVVYMRSPKTIANQKAVMEYLLINHPLDCPVCDQAGECHLQDYSYQYGRSQSRFLEEKVKQPTKDIGPHVKLYADRCIMCSRCVRFCNEVTGTGEIGVFGRGHTEQIDIFPSRPLDNELSGNVVDICPVGALLDKDFLFAQRVWFLQSTASVDGITASGDNIWIHHNEGRIYRIKPRPNPQVNQWWISDQIRYSHSYVHHADRLKSPMRLQFSAPVTVTWTSACRYASDQLQRLVRDNGPGCLALIVSPMLACEEAYLLARFALALDPKAALAVGPIPISGKDKTFPGRYTVRAEKCPNSRGVRRSLALASGECDAVLSFTALLEKLQDKAAGVRGLVVTGNYPDPGWVDKDLVKAAGGKFVLMIDTLGNDLAARADIVLPGATWAEKSGTFENASDRLQSFHQAIAPLAQARSEGQIALDLAACCGAQGEALYDARRTRARMGGPFANEVHEPELPAPDASQMEYVPL